MEIYLVQFSKNDLSIWSFLKCFKIVYDFSSYSIIRNFSVAIDATRVSIELTIFIVKLKELFVKVSRLESQYLELFGVLGSIEYINVSFV